MHSLSPCQQRFFKINFATCNMQQRVSCVCLLITSQAARCHQLDEENRQLREQIFHLKAIQPTLLSVKSLGLEKADATTTRTLNSRLEDIGLPSDIAEKLSARSITKVFDLIRLSESQLSRIDGIPPIDLDTIVTTLRLVGSPSGAASFCAGTSYQGTEARSDGARLQPTSHLTARPGSTPTSCTSS